MSNHEITSKRIFQDLLVRTLFCSASALTLVALIASCCIASAESGPPPDYKLNTDPDLAFTSPDGATKLMQYKKETEDYDIKWQVWARHGEQMSELKPEQDYPAGFRFTNDSQWLVRMQKTAVRLGLLRGVSSFSPGDGFAQSPHKVRGESTEFAPHLALRGSTNV